MYQVKIVGRRLDEEEVLKEEVRSRRREEGRGRERREEERRVVELSRAERNREWRRRKEEEQEEGPSPVEEREGVLELALLRELECLGCGGSLVAPQPVLQCLGGHVACTDCRDRGKVGHTLIISTGMI